MPGASASPSRSAKDILAELSREHRPALLRYFSRKGFSAPDCEDGAQEVLLRLAKRADLLADVAGLQGYLFTTASNVATDFLRTSIRRRASKHDEYQDAQHALLELTPDDVLQGQEALATVFLALNELPERTRTIFILVRLEHMSQVQVARRLDVALSTVEKHIAKAISYLSKRVERP